MRLLGVILQRCKRFFRDVPSGLKEALYEDCCRE
jgi:hypothetical protein